MNNSYDALIDAAGQKYNVDPALIKTVFHLESSGNPDTRDSPAGAQGGMQIMPQTAATLGVNPRDIAQAIDGGTRYLRQGLDDTGSPAGALAFYHGGPDRSIWGPKTAAYVAKGQTLYPTMKVAQVATDPDVEAGRSFVRSLATGSAPQSTDADVAAGKAFVQSLGAPAESAAPVAAPPEATPMSESEMTGRQIASAGRIATAAGQGAAEGFGSAPLGMDDRTRQTLQNIGLFNKPGETPTPMRSINEAVINPLVAGADLALRSGNALLRGGQGLVAQTGAEVGAPILGRDIAALPEALIPEIGRYGVPARGNMLAGERAAVREAPPNMLAGDRQLPPDMPTMTVRPDAAPNEAAPQPGMAQSVGAAASREGTDPAMLAEKTPAQRLRDLQSSVQQTAEDRAGPQMNDQTRYVPGIPPRLLASQEFTPLNALDEKVAIAADPHFRADVEANAKARNEGMVDLLRNDAADPIAVERAHEARSQVSPPALGVFKDEKPVDASGLVSTIQGYLDGPDGKQRAVRSTLNDVMQSLRNKDGELETAPSMLYGARKNLTDLLKKGVKGVGDAADDVRASKHILAELLPEFDKTISEGAPKFSSEYLPQFSELSKPINQMEFLQQYQTGSKKITDGNGYLIPSKVQKMLDDVLQGNKAAGVNSAKSLTDEQIQNIINVRNELFAGSLKDRLGAVRGSDSFQQINRAITPLQSPLKTAVRGTATIGAHAGLAANPSTAVWGNALLGAYQGIIKPAMDAKKAQAAAKAIADRKAQLLAQPNRLAP